MKALSDVAGSVKNHINYFLKKCYRDNINALAGQSAFFMILSAAPAVMFVFSIFSILTGKQPDHYGLTPLYKETESYAPFIIRFVETSIQEASSGRAVLTAIIALWSASLGMYCITEGILRIYRIPSKHSWLYKRIFSMGYTVLMLAILLVSIGATAFSIFFADTAAELLELDSGFHYFLYVLLYVALGYMQALLMALALKLFLNKKVTDKRIISMRALMPGMLLTVIAWYLLTFGMMIYLRIFAVSSIYGSLTSLIVLMVWVYCLMFILLFCIQLNYIYRKRLIAFGPLIWFESLLGIKKVSLPDDNAPILPDPTDETLEEPEEPMTWSPDQQ